MPTQVRFPGWDRGQEALRLSVRIVEVSAGHLNDFEFPVLVTSLHALERRYTRSFPDDRNVLNELAELASYFHERGALRAGRLRAGEGSWRFEIVDLLGVPVIGVRTYVVVPALPGAHVFVDKMGRIRASWDGRE